MFCSKCGKEIFDEAVICPNCGCMVKEVSTSAGNTTNAPVIENNEKPGLATGALVCSIIIPIVGLILGIIGAVKYKTAKLKNKCIIAIVLSIVVWIISFIIIGLMY